MNMWTRWPSVDRSPAPAGFQWPANLMVAQGPAAWPRGRRAANEAEEILAEAVAWWDVARSGFRDGDRWLRNLGQGGSPLDLRLGSSLLANSNDPLFLPVDQFGYIYLTGVAGNSVSCTAPASAASFAAYPVGGAAATTGAATGGATFTFSTVGSWTRVDLLDAGAVVVASFDGDLLTSGAATSLTDSYAVAWTINRSTSGRKSVAMPARRNGGRACMLLGTDDYLEVVDAQQHGALNFFASNAFTVAVVVRSWNNASGIFHMFIAKGDSTNVGFPGYYLFRGNGTPATRLQINDNAIAIGGAQTQNISNGTLSLVAGVRNTLTRRFGVTINGATITPITDTTTTGMANTSRLRVGNRSSAAANDFADMEFRCAAIWRRALTAREITTINNANLWGT